MYLARTVSNVTNAICEKIKKNTSASRSESEIEYAIQPLSQRTSARRTNGCIDLVGGVLAPYLTFPLLYPFTIAVTLNAYCFFNRTP